MLRCSTFAKVALMTVLGLLAACSSSEESAEDESSEGALEAQAARFTFRPNSPKERAGEVDPANTYWMARLADLAYFATDEATTRRLLTEIGMEPQEIVPLHASKSLNPLETRELTGTDGFYVRTREAGFLVFRGSENGKLNDAIVDARIFKISAGPHANNAGDGSVHEGFYHALHAVWDDIHDILKRRHGDKRLPLYITGHSLGAAIGTVATHHLLFDGCLTQATRHIDILNVCEKEYIPVAALYTFGSPRTGDEEFAHTLTTRMQKVGTKVFRFVSEEDQVTMVPRYIPVVPLVKPFRHVGDKGEELKLAIFLGRDGKMFPRPESRCAENRSIVQCDVSTSALADGLLNSKPFWKGEHAMKLYAEKLRGVLTGKAPELEKVRDELRANNQY